MTNRSHGTQAPGPSLLWAAPHLPLRVSSSFLGLVYLGNRDTQPHPEHTKPSTRPAPLAASSAVGSSMYWDSAVPPHASHGVLVP